MRGSVLTGIIGIGLVAACGAAQGVTELDPTTVDAGAPAEGAGTTIDLSLPPTDAALVDASTDASDASDATTSETVSSVTTGRWQTCFVMSTGRVFCSGINTNKPVLVPGITDAVELIFGSQGEAVPEKSHTCIRRKAGTVSCWGNNEVGQLGDGTTMPRTGIVDVTGLSSVVQISGTPGRKTCARITGGAVKCWGLNDLADLGNGTLTDSPIPTTVTGLTDAVQVGGTCAIRVGGQVVCWGGNSFGGLGDGSFAHTACARGGSSFDCSPTPVNVSGLTDAKSISGNSSTMYAIRNDGTVWAWGRAASGALGDGLTTHIACPGGDCSPVPIAVGISADQIAAGRDGACARVGGSVKCWGHSGNGRNGNGEFTSANSPVDVFSLTNAVSLTAGFSSVCATRVTGVISCWGQNEGGSLGIGTYTLAIGYPMNVVW